VKMRAFAELHRPPMLMLCADPSAGALSGGLRTSEGQLERPAGLAASAGLVAAALPFVGLFLEGEESRTMLFAEKDLTVSFGVRMDLGPLSSVTGTLDEFGYLRFLGMDFPFFT
jgi:hypothetical protein